MTNNQKYLRGRARGYDKGTEAPKGPERVELFDAKGKPLGLFDVCQWWIETYPKDVFQRAPGPRLSQFPSDTVVRIRELMERLLKETRDFIKKN